MVCVVALLAVASGRMAFRFAAGIENILGRQADESFTCDDKPYGYYADPQNECKIFHVCLPVPNDDGEVGYSYIVYMLGMV
ncbi:UNVERIFIED_CONTAM: hypothetical protein GTU68_040260 [Idotea baltica]|nr:hypothetical protein [Idotea baltica]